MRGLLYATLTVSLLANFATRAQSEPLSDHGASQISNSGPSSQNSTGQTSGSSDRTNLAAGAEESTTPKPAAPHQTEVAATPDGKPHWLSDPKSGCAALDIHAPPADAVAWSGHCVGGLASGPGTMTFSNQGKLLAALTGEFDKGALRDGHVTMKWADGSSYDGDGVAARMEGSGRFVTAAGDRFEGQWIGDHLNGHGLAVWANGDRYDGEWRDGKADGPGVQTWADGRKYDGEWHNDLPNGHGVVTRKDGSRYEGDFADGLPKEMTPIAAAAGSDNTATATHATTAVWSATNPAETGDVTANNQDSSGQNKNDAQSAVQRSSIGGITGKKFFAIDGSTLALTTIESGLTREIVAPNGTEKKDVFIFLNDNLGTVSEDEDNGKVAGVFRLTEKGIATDYSDGRSETFYSNNSGGVSMTLNAPTSGTYCMAWYPEGHKFSTEERKAALAEYASRLGLDEPRRKTSKPSAKPVCGSAAGESGDAWQGPGGSPASRQTPAAAKLTPVPRPAMRAEMPHSLMQREAAAPAVTAASLTTPAPRDPGHPIEVKDSKVHMIDSDSSTTSQTPDSQALASNEPANSTNGASASSCLSVESDGKHWDFRNHCGYDVQFAYCLMNANDPLAACSKGAVSGSVAPNGFSALIADQSLSETNADHDFRWVACGGGAGEVVVRLDRVDPPIGRCVRPGAS